MTYSQAMHLLGLREGFTLEELKSAFRQAAKRYHPDTGSVEASAEKFIQANRAYEVLLEYLRSGRTDVRSADIDPLLQDRLDMVMRAFEHLMNTLAARFSQMGQDIVNDIARQLASYGDKERLRQQFEKDARRIVSQHLRDFLQLVCSGLDQLVQEHNAWLNGLYNSVFCHYRSLAIAQAWKSPLNWIMGIALSLGAFLFLQHLWQLEHLLLVAGLVVVPHLLQSGYVSWKWRDNRFRLQTTVSDLLPQRGLFDPQIGNVVSQQEAAGVGGIGGAVLGSLFAGPIGAIVGGILGGLFGSLFGEPYHVTAQRVLEAFVSTLDRYLQAVAQQLDDDLHAAYNRLLQQIVESYTQSKQETLKMLPP